MPRAPFISGLSFRSKMVLTVTTVVVLLLAVSLWLTSQRFKSQIHDNAAELLRTAEGVLKIRQRTRTQELMLRFNSAKNEPRFKAAAAGLLGEQKAWQTAEGQKTLKGVLEAMVRDGVADVIVLTPEPSLEHAVAVANDAQFDTKKFEIECADAVKLAFSGQPQADVAAHNGRLFDIVTIPINVGDDIVGAITFAVENSMAGEFEQMMRKEDDLVLLLDGRVVASTLPNESLADLVSQKFAGMAARTQATADIQEIVLGDEHFWGLAGRLDDQRETHKLGYLVLSSYEKPLQILRSTQQTIVITGLLTILSGIVAVWLLVRKITEPLNELHDSAEAVGRGDFSRRVNIRTRDEFGELARAFNHMTENIELSQSRLKQAVDTLKSTQAQLIHSEKLSAVGEFVAGVAHELNNPLTSVMGFSELLMGEDVDEKHRGHLEIIFKSAQRCQKIVQSLLSFARHQQPERKLVGVNKLIEDVLEVVAYPLRTSNVRVITQFSPTLPLVLADGHQIQQVVLNIINNARQAIEANQPAGRITITTIATGETVRIILEDDGPGISPENLQRIFNPFFTTKEVGQGTGLGLSLCYGIIKEHGGNITPTSAPGAGATFTNELPAASATTGLMAPADSGSGDHHPDFPDGAGKRILVVDDEEFILQVIQEELHRHHFEIVTASNGETALSRMREEKFDVILCDLKMPGLNGRQIYERLRSENAELCRRMVFITGDVVNEPLRQFLAAEKCPCLSKPFKLAELRQIIQTMISAQ